ncbi:MAG: CdaR family protein [bacterium]|nr:CdaR family protein [bacterium]
MKKISNKRGFLKKIYNFFDKFIITPITKLIMIISELFKFNKSGLDRFLNKKQSLLIISLIAAFAFSLIVDNKITPLIDNSAEVLYGQPVRAIYNEELYVVEGVPETADVTLIGRKWDVYLAKQYPADEIVLDLQDLKVGTHKVTAKYKQSVLSVDYKLDPSTVTIVVYEKVSANRELSYDIIHKDKLDTKLNIESVSLNRDTVIIKGAEYKLEQVASVKALIDIESISSPKVGSMTLSNVPLVAYDGDGNPIDVEVVPSSVDATIKISSPSKTVPIKVTATGNLNNKSIKSLTPSDTNVTIYGSENALSDVEYVEAVVDVEGIKENKKYSVNLKKPSGVREMSLDKITVNVELDNIATMEVEGIRINPIGLSKGLKVQALSEKDSSITVVLKGSESVIKNIDASSIKVYIDLTDLDVGDYEVDIKVSGEDDRVLYTSKLKKVKVRISEN